MATKYAQSYGDGIIHGKRWRKGREAMNKISINKSQVLDRKYNATESAFVPSSFFSALIMAIFIAILVI